jgi:hypothetical protein
VTVLQKAHGHAAAHSPQTHHPDLHRITLPAG